MISVDLVGIWLRGDRVAVALAVGSEPGVIRVQFALLGGKDGPDGGDRAVVSRHEQHGKTKLTAA